eukprot:CAMPEP_0205910200 /NCGR_PEP_ID=MMETSP1325-20131115/4305_1 /ASSEMBLY_ACC=CAM_ASM_000708 /TAXON_ID=236786 /ORGANISM="Florenciella sp., Strain RCC1007" /LENGTH=99 /DNA_ID=CAMNT_0053276537 /DNA_START=292 /DNA_END=588 /DNA_ORIENTATION=-
MSHVPCLQGADPLRIASGCLTLPAPLTGGLAAAEFPLGRGHRRLRADPDTAAAACAGAPSGADGELAPDAATAADPGDRGAQRTHAEQARAQRAGGRRN